MYRKILIVAIAIFIADMAFAQVYTSLNYTLFNARIVTSGGSARSGNYSFNSVKIGSPFGGKAESANYSLDASRSDRIMPPNAPTLNPVISPTNVSSQTLSGTKEKGTSIYINSSEAVPLNYDTLWSCDKTLTEGDNDLLITARNRYNLESEAVYVNIILDTAPPIIIIDSPPENTMTYSNQITVTGTIDETTFSEEKDLNFGLNTILIEATDAAGNTSSKGIEVYRTRVPVTLPE